LEAPHEAGLAFASSAAFLSSQRAAPDIVAWPGKAARLNAKATARSGLLNQDQKW
jgi:hypothetical protein